MQSCAIALGPHGIRCNAILPGTIATAINVEDLKDETKEKAMAARTCVGRLGVRESVSALPCDATSGCADSIPTCLATSVSGRHRWSGRVLCLGPVTVLLRLVAPGGRRLVRQSTVKSSSWPVSAVTLYPCVSLASNEDGHQLRGDAETGGPARPWRRGDRRNPEAELASGGLLGSRRSCHSVRLGASPLASQSPERIIVR